MSIAFIGGALLAFFICVSLFGLVVRERTSDTGCPTDSAGDSPADMGESENQYLARMRFQEFSHAEDRSVIGAAHLDDNDQR